ncbi:hypothetical protein F3J34_15405 [Klebsiella sp. Ap-873]|nr:hypothetical protein [Klebsiella sp. Ap-873]
MSNEKNDKSKKPTEQLLDFNRAARNCHAMAKIAELRAQMDIKKRGKS